MNVTRRAMMLPVSTVFWREVTVLDLSQFLFTWHIRMRASRSGTLVASEISLSEELFRIDFDFRVRPVWKNQVSFLWMRRPCFGVFIDAGIKTVAFALSLIQGNSRDGVGSFGTISVGL